MTPLDDDVELETELLENVPWYECENKAETKIVLVVVVVVVVVLIPASALLG